MGYRFWYEFCREMHWRWSFIPTFLVPRALSLRQWVVSAYGEDCDSIAKKEVIKQQYLDLLDIMEEILSNQPFLFGNYPTLVDFGFAGPFFRHFSSDFTPRKVMQLRAPAVYEWVARLWNCKSSKLTGENGFPVAGQLPHNWSKMMCLLHDFFHYSHLNAVAYRDGNKEFKWRNGGQEFRVPVVRYRVYCRMKLQQLFDSLDGGSKERVKEILEKHDLWDLFWRDGVIETPPECEMEPPFVVYPPPSRGIFKEGMGVHKYTYKWDYDSIFARYLGGVGVQFVVGISVVGMMSWIALAKFKK